MAASGIAEDACVELEGNIDVDAGLPWFGRAGSILWEFANQRRVPSSLKCHGQQAAVQKRATILAWREDGAERQPARFGEMQWA